MDSIKTGSRWRRPGYSKDKGPYNGYTVLFVTNTKNLSDFHPPQVVYRGDNGGNWSMPLSDWPGKLIPEERVGGHVLYSKEDFEDENPHNIEAVADLVCNGGLGICMFCLAAESELDYPCKEVLDGKS